MDAVDVLAVKVAAATFAVVDASGGAARGEVGAGIDGGLFKDAGVEPYFVG